MAARQRSCAALLLPFIALIVVYQCLLEPEPRPASSPASTFSAARAAQYLARAFPEHVPHPTGSAAQVRARERLVEILSGLGYRPEVHSAESCGELGVCAQVSNVLAVFAGTSAAPAVLLTAHYDSVPASPGAGDDGAGVGALLEIARILKLGPALERTVLLLLSDGEEFAMLGARAFSAGPGRLMSIGDVVNLDARGTSGPSLLFEVGPSRGGRLSRALDALPRPVASAVFTSIYAMLGGGTDFSVYRDAGAGGLNFAFVAGAERYHTAHDTLDQLSLGSLQHHGDNALAAVRSLAREPAAEDPSADDATDLVFTDLLARKVIHLPALRVPILAASFLLLWVVAIVARMRRARISPRHVARSALVQLASILVATVLGAALTAGLALAAGVPERDGLLGYLGMPLGDRRAGLFMISTLSLAVLLPWRARQPRPSVDGAHTDGLCLLWIPAACVMSCVTPAAAFPLLLASVPVLILALWSIRGQVPPWSSGVSAAWAGLILYPLAALAPDAVGFIAYPACAALITAVAAGALPCIDDLSQTQRRALMTLAVTGVALSALALLDVAASSRLLNANVHLHAETALDRTRCVEVVEASERGLLQPADALRHDLQFEQPYPWSPPRPLLAETLPSRSLTAPVLTVTSSRSGPSGSRFISADVRSPRHADSLILFFPPGVELASIALNGQPAFARAYEGDVPADGWRRIVYEGLGARTLRLDLQARTSSPVPVYVVDRSYGVPPDVPCKLSLQRRGYAPVKDGDQVLVSARLDL
jgi:hypothetical protein